MAELTAIWLKRAPRAAMEARQEARVVAGRGLEGNSNQGGRRQVTLLAAEAWKRVEAELGYTVDPSTRRANLMVRGIELREARGRILSIGSCRILIRGETRPCWRMEAGVPGLEAVLKAEWRGGVDGEVLTGGEIAVGDAVAWQASTGGEVGAPNWNSRGG